MKKPSMSPRTLDPRRAIENCIYHLHSWRPFQIHQSKTLGSDSPKPYATAQGNGFFSKRPCRADRGTAFSVEALDMSKLSLFEEDRPLSVKKRDSTRWIARKRRRRGSRSVSGKSSERSGTRLRCCSVGASAACGTCSDFVMAPGTDTSGELFVIGDLNWASDVSEAARTSRREREIGFADRESFSAALQIGNVESQGNESGYGSEQGYRGDGEIGYDDEFDEEEEDQRLLFWGHEFGVSKAEKMGKNALQKAHHRCRRRKHDIKMVDLMR